MALYTDRAGWAFYTPTAGGKVDLTRPTQLGRALHRLGHRAHSQLFAPGPRPRRARSTAPCKAGSSTNSRVAGITTVAAANAYLRERFIADYDAQFTHPPSRPGPAFVPLGAVDLEHILCHEEERTVGQDNVVVLDGLPLQVAQAARPPHLRRPPRDRAPRISRAPTPSGGAPSAWAATTPGAAPPPAGDTETAPPSRNGLSAPPGGSPVHAPSRAAALRASPPSSRPSHAIGPPVA